MWVCVGPLPFKPLLSGTAGWFRLILCIPHLCAGTGHFSKEPWFLLLERFTEVRKARGGTVPLAAYQGHILSAWLKPVDGVLEASALWRFFHVDLSKREFLCSPWRRSSTSLAERRATYIWNLEFFCVGSWYIPHLLIYSHICLYTSVVFVFSVYFVVCNPILLIKLFHLWPLSRVLWAFSYSLINVFVLCFWMPPYFLALKIPGIILYISTPALESAASRVALVPFISAWC